MVKVAMRNRSDYADLNPVICCSQNRKQDEGDVCERGTGITGVETRRESGISESQVTDERRK